MPLIEVIRMGMAEKMGVDISQPIIKEKPQTKPIRKGEPKREVKLQLRGKIFP